MQAAVLDRKQRRAKKEVESFKNETKNSIILADQMANSVQLQQEVQNLCDCRACVFKFDVQNTVWTDTGGISRIQLIRTPLVYKIDGRLESTGQITISVTLGQNTEYESIENDPDQYRLTISPQEVYVFRLVASSDDKNFSIVLQNVLRILRASKSRIEELPPSPRDAWVKEAATSSPSQPITEQFLKSSYLGTRVPSTRHLEPVNSPLGSTVTSHIPNLNEQRSLQNQQTIGTPCSPTSSMRRSDFEVYIETLCITLADAISKGDVQAASEITEIMAQQRIPLSIKMKNPKVVSVEHGDKTIDLKVVVEDRETSGGSFVMKVLTTTTIKTLQEEVAERFGFPPKVQRWIIGKMMAGPSQTLADCHVHKAGHTAFLYLVSGKTAGLKRQEFERYRRGKEGNIDSSASELQIPNGTSENTGSTSSLPATTSPLSRATSMPALQNAGLPRAEGIVIGEPSSRTLNRNPPPPSPNMRVNQGGLTRRDDKILTASSISSIQRELQRQEMGILIDEEYSMPVEDTEVPQGWRCSQCTYINTPTRPGCEICAADRPQDYIVPENTMVREQERIRMEEERRQQELFEQALQEQEQERAMTREINFRQLVQTAQQSLIENTEEFDCAICFTTVLPGEGVMLRECLHCFCRDCLREHIRNCTDPEVQCPFQDDEFACHSLITAQEIKSLLSVEDFDKFLNRSLVTAESQAANSFHCKTPNCPGWCIYEDNSNIFHCPVCDKQNCLTCKAQHFPEMNCKEYQEDLKRRAKNDQAAKQTQEFLEKMITKGDAMKCPQCQIILLKKDGCDWMRCSMCRLEICWATRGPRWGPQGVGDLSGGCKCRVQGKKCHPKCRNCH